MRIVLVYYVKQKNSAYFLPHGPHISGMMTFFWVKLWALLFNLFSAELEWIVFGTFWLFSLPYGGSESKESNESKSKLKL